MSKDLSFIMMAEDGGWKSIIVDTLEWRGHTYLQGISRGIVWTSDTAGTFTASTETIGGTISYEGVDSCQEAPLIFNLSMRSVYGQCVKQRARAACLKQILDMASRIVIPMEKAIKNYEQVSSTFGKSTNDGKV